MEHQGQGFARKLELLLAQFPHPEGRPWRGTEIEVETKGLVSQQYFSMLRTGKLRRPGLEQLAAVADVMGFPFELWRAEPEQWSRILDERSTRDRQFQNGKELARKFEVVRSAIMNPRTNQPFTDEEIVRRSNGLLTLDDVRAIQSGKGGALTYDQILALSDVFDVSFEYWTEPIEGDKPLLDAETLEALRSESSQLLLHRSRNLSKAHKNMLLIIAEQLAKAEQEGE